MSYVSFYGMLISLGIQLNYLRKLRKDPSIGNMVWKRSLGINLGASTAFLLSMWKQGKNEKEMDQKYLGNYGVHQLK